MVQYQSPNFVRCNAVPSFLNCLSQLYRLGRTMVAARNSHLHSSPDFLDWVHVGRTGPGTLITEVGMKTSLSSSPCRACSSSFTLLSPLFLLLSRFLCCGVVQVRILCPTHHLFRHDHQHHTYATNSNLSCSDLPFQKCFPTDSEHPCCSDFTTISE